MNNINCLQKLKMEINKIINEKILKYIIITTPSDDNIHLYSYGGDRDKFIQKEIHGKLPIDCDELHYDVDKRCGVFFSGNKLWMVEDNTFHDFKNRIPKKVTDPQEAWEILDSNSVDSKMVTQVLLTGINRGMWI